jgi:hypothetical protein
MYTMISMGITLLLKPRILKVSKIDCLRFVMCPILGPVLIGFFYFIFAVAVNSTIEVNKAGSMPH